MNIKKPNDDPFNPSGLDDGFDADDTFMDGPASPEVDAWERVAAGARPTEFEADVAAEIEPEDQFEGFDSFDDELSAPSTVAESQDPAHQEAYGEDDGQAYETHNVSFELPPHIALNYSDDAVDGGMASVPRISIHIYYERSETAENAQKAIADRRMVRAQSQILPGGLSAAVERYQSEPTPQLIMVECLDTGPGLLELLDRLAEVCDPGTKVVVLGAANDIALYRQLMKRGVSEYLVPPLNTVQLIQAVTNLYTDPSAPFVGRVVAFLGAKGGVGASTVAHNFAHTLAERMATSTVMVDFDLPFGTAGLDFNQDPLQGVADALSQPDRLDDVLLERLMVRCTDRLSLFAAPANLDTDYDISPAAFEEVANKIRNTAPFVVWDLPHLWSAWMRQMLMTADDVVIVATPDLASLRNAKNMIDLIRAGRPNDAPPRLVLNQVGVVGRPEIPVKDFGDALGIPPSLVLPWEPKLFGDAANNGQMLAEVNAKSKVAEGLDNLVHQITRREPPVVAKTSALARLFKRK
jgi:pilus assembly protein CpaE